MRLQWIDYDAASGRFLAVIAFSTVVTVTVESGHRPAFERICGEMLAEDPNAADVFHRLGQHLAGVDPESCRIDCTGHISVASWLAMRSGRHKPQGGGRSESRNRPGGKGVNTLRKRSGSDIGDVGYYSPEEYRRRVDRSTGYADGYAGRPMLGRSAAYREGHAAGSLKTTSPQLRAGADPGVVLSESDAFNG